MSKRIAVLLLFCIGCAGSGPAASVVGKWEPAATPFGLKEATYVEFKSDGTGFFSVPDFIGTISGKSKGMQKVDFKWEIKKETPPVLLVDDQGSKIPLAGSQFVFFQGRTHSHFKREGDTLTITSLQPNIPPLVMRKQGS